MSKKAKAYVPQQPKKIGFKPLNNNVLIRVINKTVTDGGILLPDVTNSRIGTGVIEEIGDTISDIFGKEINMGLSKGDTVYYNKMEAVEIKPMSGQFLVAYKSLLGKAA